MHAANFPDTEPKMIDQFSYTSSVNHTREGKAEDTADRFDSLSKRGSKQEAANNSYLKTLP